MPRLPLSPRKVVSLVGEVRSLAGEPGRLLVAGTDPAYVSAVRDALTGGAAADAAGYMVESAVFDSGSIEAVRPGAGGATVVIVVVATGELSSDWFKSGMAALGGNGTPLVLVLTRAPGIEVSLPEAGIGPRRVVSIAPDGTPPADVLAAAVVDAAGERAVALAAMLPSLREETCRQLARRAARQNGVIGVLFFLPGTDMPVMTLNEARMILRIAAAHGEDIGTERALELLSVVGSGFGLRAVARQALNLLPGPAWIIKGGVAYGGTLALGRAARAYFDGNVRVTPARLAPLVDRVKRIASNP